MIAAVAAKLSSRWKRDPAVRIWITIDSLSGTLFLVSVDVGFAISVNVSLTSSFAVDKEDSLSSMTLAVCFSSP